MSATRTAPVPPGAIRLDGASKRYAIGRNRSLLQGFRRPAGAEHWALREADLDIRPGEAVGVLGHNGAGKTTLLRLLAGVTRPTTGRLAVAGRIAPLISVGVGFHQELSGRENVLLNGQLLGLSRGELERQLPSIVEFSGLGDVLDTPVKFYSSGMLLRLAFSVLIHLDSDVMLVDEILAVGDVAFQAKCTRRLRAAWSDGATLVLVSHSPDLVRALCPRAIVIHRGQIAFDGPSEQAVATYWELLTRGDVDSPSRPVAEVGDGELTGPEGDPTAVLVHGGEYRLRHTVRFTGAVESPQVYFNVFDDTGELVYQRLTTVGEPYRSFAAGDETDVCIRFTAGIGVGRYRLATEIRSLDGRAVLSGRGGTLTVERSDGPAGRGSAELDASIEVHAAMTGGGPASAPE